MVKGQDGANYWATGPEAGQRVLPDVEAPPEPEPDRKMLKGADGFNYYGPTREKECCRMMVNLPLQSLQPCPKELSDAGGPQTVVRNVTNQPKTSRSPPSRPA